MSNKTKIYIIDFEDSFTYNIAAELFFAEKNIEVVSYLSFFSSDKFLFFISNINRPIAVILGPGPGSSKEFGHYFSAIETLKKCPFVYLMGICLGHQILGMLDGLIVKASSNPIHGGQINIIFKNKCLLVQRYNSLALFESEKSLDEIQIRFWDRGVSYQFHPESIGTENRLHFFKDLLSFVK